MKRFHIQLLCGLVISAGAFGPEKATAERAKPAAMSGVSAFSAAAAVAFPFGAQRGARGNQGPPVEVTIGGRTWTQQELFQRNIGAPDDQTTAFPPHRVIGNKYEARRQGAPGRPRPS